jgi:hypothetical protein
MSKDNVNLIRCIRFFYEYESSSVYQNLQHSTHYAPTKELIYSLREN